MCSEPGGDGGQIVDAPRAETSVPGREQTGLLGPSKADSSKVTAKRRDSKLSRMLSSPVCACMYFACVHAHEACA